MGQVGDGTLSFRNTPTQVLASVGFKALQSGDVHTCSVSLGNLVYCWGNNERGELGYGPTTVRPSPVTVVTGPIAVPGMPVAAAEALTPQPVDGATAGLGGLRPIELVRRPARR